MSVPSISPNLLYLSRSDLIALGGGHSQPYVNAIADGLAAHARGEYVQPLKPYLRWPGADHIADRIIAMPCYLGGEGPVAGLKWIGSRHDNPLQRGLERASGLIILNDTDTNYPVAILEAGLISGMRTAAVTAVAARHLARKGFRRLVCIGCGPIARMQLTTMLEQFPSIDSIHVYDRNPDAAERLIEDVGTQFPKIVYRIETDAEGAVKRAEVLVTCTVADRPYIPFDSLPEGVFISNVSIMDLHKEVFLKADKVVVDDWEQCNREKKIIHQLVTEGSFSRARLHAELGEIVTGAKPGRESDDEIILLNPMGMAIEDIACARHFCHLAQARGAGTLLPLYE